ncbi:Replicase polyprotein 1ab [Frankliniella fusca]|uniref:Replicase polyprotein 1ab n=1 Tax=Frankliniella fusca TaxID=407009 RepID=A0AAE1HC31_9NEOP|nr:Replicase polyprotein 1ab [Frankliniella fusca]
MYSSSYLRRKASQQAKMEAQSLDPENGGNSCANLEEDIGEDHGEEENYGGEEENIGAVEGNCDGEEESGGGDHDCEDGGANEDDGDNDNNDDDGDDEDENDDNVGDGDDDGDGDGDGDGDDDGDGDGEDDDDSDAEDDLRTKLAKWSIDYGITLQATKALLDILRDQHPELPLTAETLRQATKKRLAVKVLANGEYVHIGFGRLFDCIDISKLENRTIEVDLNLDGFPIFNSTGTECWPTLGRCVSSGATVPIVIGIYYGQGKPQPLADFLQDLIHDVRTLTANGVVIRNRHFQFFIRYFLLDAPARSYIKCCMGNGSHHGCEKCEQEGYNINNYTFGLVSQIPLEPMHLVEQGAIKRFFSFVLSRGNVNVRMSPAQRNIFDALLTECQEYFPCEFSRKLRCLAFKGKWKAIEWRHLLLYVGPILFSQVLHEEVYHCFLLLHCAIFILNHEVLLQNFLDEAQTYLENFVSFSSDLFGPHFVSYNIHSLLHLVAEVRTKGSLMSFSAYPFENELRHIKKLVKSSARPLQQICKRLDEKYKFKCLRRKKQKQGFIIQHDNGPVGGFQHVVRQYKKYEGEKFTIGNSTPDHCVQFANGQIGIVENIVESAGENGPVYHAVARLFTDFSNLYEYPVESRLLGIQVVQNLNHHFTIFEWRDVKHKCVLFPYRNAHVCYPLLHSVGRFCIVDFLNLEDEEGLPETAIVPQSWILDCGTSSHWPPIYKESYLKKEPQADWSSYPILLRGTYDSYDIARSLLSKAVESNFEEDVLKPQKRSIKKPTRYKTTDSEPDLPPRRKRSAPAVAPKNTTAKKRKLPTPPPIKKKPSTATSMTRPLSNSSSSVTPVLLQSASPIRHNNFSDELDVPESETTSKNMESNVLHNQRATSMTQPISSSSSVSSQSQSGNQTCHDNLFDNQDIPETPTHSNNLETNSLHLQRATSMTRPLSSSSSGPVGTSQSQATSQNLHPIFFDKLDVPAATHSKNLGANSSHLQRATSILRPISSSSSGVTSQSQSAIQTRHNNFSDESAVSESATHSENREINSFHHLRTTFMTRPTSSLSSGVTFQSQSTIQHLHHNFSDELDAPESADTHSKNMESNFLHHERTTSMTRPISGTSSVSCQSQSAVQTRHHNTSDVLESATHSNNLGTNSFHYDRAMSRQISSLSSGGTSESQSANPTRHHNFSDELDVLGSVTHSKNLGTNSVHNQRASSISRPLSSLSSSGTTQSQSSSQSLHQNYLDTPQKSINQLLLNKLNRILLTQANHTRLLNQLIAHTGMEGPTTPRPSGWPSTLPLKDEVQFFAWEKFLHSNQNYDYAINYFSNAVCDTTYQACTRQILAQIISKSLKPHLNWTGTEKKYGIRDRRTGQLIVGAVRKRFKEVSPKKVGTEISKWLRNNLRKKATEDCDESNRDDDNEDDVNDGDDNESGEDLE